jgi:hypothetical protein
LAVKKKHTRFKHLVGRHSKVHEGLILHNKEENEIVNVNEIPKGCDNNGGG